MNVLRKHRAAKSARLSFLGSIALGSVSATLLAVSLAGTAQAQTIIVGNGGIENVFPFGSSYRGEYQQIYSAASFSGPVVISRIAFASVGGFSKPYSFSGTLSIGTTGATPLSTGNN